MGFWEEDHRRKVPFSSHQVKGTCFPVSLLILIPLPRSEKPRLPKLRSQKKKVTEPGVEPKLCVSDLGASTLNHSAMLGID